MVWFTLHVHVVSGFVLGRINKYMYMYMETNIQCRAHVLIGVAPAFGVGMRNWGLGHLQCTDLGVTNILACELVGDVMKVHYYIGQYIIIYITFLSCAVSVHVYIVC